MLLPVKNLIPFPKAKTEWFRIVNRAENAVDLFIYDVVGDSWIESDAAHVVKQINAITATQINLRINSPGGSVFDGHAIYNALLRHPAKITTYVDGVAASIASVIALAGSKIIMAENSMMMIHNPSTIVWGTSEELRRHADVLEQVKETIVNVYESRTSKERSTIAKAMDEETWFTAQEALDWGLATEVQTGVKAAACADPATYLALGILKAPLPSPPTPRNFSRKLALMERRLKL